MAGEPSQVSGQGNPSLAAGALGAGHLSCWDRTPLYGPGGQERHLPAWISRPRYQYLSSTGIRQRRAVRRGRHCIDFNGTHGPVLVSDKILVSLVLTNSINLNHLHTGLSQTSLPHVAQHWSGFEFAPLPWFSDHTVEFQRLAW